MRKLFCIAALMIFLMTSCSVTTTATVDENGVYIETTESTIENIIKYGTPFYYNGAVEYYLYHGFYFYPYYYGNKWYYYRYKYPFRQGYFHRYIVRTLPRNTYNHSTRMFNYRRNYDNKGFSNNRGAFRRTPPINRGNIGGFRHGGHR